MWNVSRLSVGNMLAGKLRQEQEQEQEQQQEQEREREGKRPHAVSYL